MTWGKNVGRLIVSWLYKRQKTFVGQWHSPFKKVAGLNAGAAPLEIATGETLVGPRTPAAFLGTHSITHHLKLTCWQQHDTLITISEANCHRRCFCGFDSAPSRLFCRQSLSRIAVVAGWSAVSNHWYSPDWPQQNPVPQFQLNPQQSIFFIGLSMSSIRWVTPTSLGMSPGGGQSRAVNARRRMEPNEELCVKPHLSISNTPTQRSLTG